MNFLERILDTKRDEVARLRREEGLAALRRRAAEAPPTRGFCAALAREHPIALIAEVKKASPSKGVIEPDFRPVEIACAYERAGAAALSVLTDATYFQGGNDVLATVRAAVRVPVLRKDFIIDEIQIYEARAIGADAVLLIAAALDDVRLREFHALAHDLALDALVEVHGLDEWERAAHLHPPLAGVNNRDLRTFTVDLEQTARVGRRVPGDTLLVSESGIASADDVRRVRTAGARAILVGETLMRLGVGGVEEGAAALLAGARAAP